MAPLIGALSPLIPLAIHVTRPLSQMRLDGLVGVIQVWRKHLAKYLLIMQDI